MLILSNTDEVAALTNLPLRRLIQRRIEEISEYGPWDADELGPYVVVEPGDTDDDVQSATGFSILRSPYDGTRFGDPGFSPAFEFAESHGDQLFELVYIVSDGGYGHNIMIVNAPGVDPSLLAFCQTYAVAAEEIP